jgi:hypothetical protein
MAQAVAISVSQAVSATANAVATVAASDTESANNISSALKIYISNVTKIPSTAADIVLDLEHQIVSRGGKMTDSVGSAVKIIARDMYDSMRKNPNSIKSIGNMYIGAVDSAVLAAQKNISAMTQTAGSVRGAIVENIAGTIVLPLRIATQVASDVKRTLKGGFSPAAVNYYWIILVVITLIIIIWMYVPAEANIIKTNQQL